MKKAALLLLLVALLASACATPGEKPASTPDMRSTVTPQGATPSAGAATAPTTTSPLATPTGEMRTLTVLTHDSYALSDEVLQQFEQANNAKVQFIKQGDAGQALTRAILTKDNPEADVIFGVDNTFMSRALEAEGSGAVSAERIDQRSARVSTRSDTAVDSDRLRRCVFELRQGILRGEEVDSAADTGRSHEARIQELAGGREFCRIITGIGIHAGDGVGVW